MQDTTLTVLFEDDNGQTVKIPLNFKGVSDPDQNNKMLTDDVARPVYDTLKRYGRDTLLLRCSMTPLKKNKKETEDDSAGSKKKTTKKKATKKEPTESPIYGTMRFLSFDPDKVKLEVTALVGLMLSLERSHASRSAIHQSMQALFPAYTAIDTCSQDLWEQIAKDTRHLTVEMAPYEVGYLIMTSVYGYPVENEECATKLTWAGAGSDIKKH